MTTTEMTVETTPEIRRRSYVMGGRIPAFMGLAQRTGGVYVENPPTIAEALKQTGLDFEVKMEGVQATYEDIEIGPDGPRTVVRTAEMPHLRSMVAHFDDGRPPVGFQTGSPSYTPVQNRDGLAFGQHIVDGGDGELVAIVPSSHVISWADTDTRSSISVGGKHWAKLDVSTGGRTGDLELRGVPTELLRVLLVAIAQTTGSRPADWPDKHLWLPDASGLACVACGDDEGANDHLQPEDPAHVWMDLEGLTAGDVDRLSGLGEGYGVQLVLDWIAEGGDFRDHYAPRELRIRARQAEKVAA